MCCDIEIFSKKKTLLGHYCSTWTDEGCMAGIALDGGVSAVKLTQLSWLGGGGEWDDHMPSPDTGAGGGRGGKHHKALLNIQVTKFLMNLHLWGTCLFNKMKKLGNKNRMRSKDLGYSIPFLDKNIHLCLPGFNTVSNSNTWVSQARCFYRQKTIIIISCRWKLSTSQKSLLFPFWQRL